MKGILAGICISLGGAAYLKIGGVEWAILFAFGLLTIVHYKYPLYTGMAGFFDYSSKEGWENLLLTLLLNCVGCLVGTLLIGFDGADVIFSRIEAGYLTCFTRAILCGMIMTFVVGAAREGNRLPLIWGITLFIACGFYHSIADCFYMFSSLEDWELVRDYLPYWGVLVIGNFVGCNIPREYGK